MAGRKQTRKVAPAAKENYATELREDITKRIVEGLKNNLVPWRRPWSNDPNCGAPCNIVSKKPYNGINPMLLELTSMVSQYKSKWWGTYKQFADLKGQVRKGEKGTHIVYYRVIEKDVPPKDGQPAKKQKIFFMRTYTVFNLDQVDGDALAKYRVKPVVEEVDNSKFENWEPAEIVIAATDAQIEFGGNRACYMRPVGEWPKHTGGDYIRMPHKGQFTDPAEFYVTQFHELGHWSEVRLDWTGSYAMGELIAEITGCYLAAETGVPNLSMENHNKYLATWLKEMQSDPKWIFQAATQASKTADFILSHSRKVDSDHEQNEPTGAEEVADQAA